MEHLKREFIIYSAIAFVLIFTLCKGESIVAFFKHLKTKSKSAKIKNLEQQLEELKRKSK